MNKIVCLILIAIALASSGMAEVCVWNFTLPIPGLVDRSGGDCDCRGETYPIYNPWPKNGMSYTGGFWHLEKSARFSVGGISGNLYKCYPDMYPGHFYYALFPGYSKAPIGQTGLFFASHAKSGYIYDSGWEIYVDDFYNNNWFWTDFKQADYPNDYMNHTKTTIADAGCLVCTYANSINREGNDTDPSRLNAWLSSHNGYEGIRARLYKVAEYAGLGYKSGVAAKECIMRGLSSSVAVKNKGHWVNLVMFNGVFSMGDYRILDPAGRTNHLDGYWGVSESTTRSLYSQMLIAVASQNVAGTATAGITSVPSKQSPATKWLASHIQKPSARTQLKASVSGGIFFSPDIITEREGTAEPYVSGGIMIYASQPALTLVLKRNGEMIASAEEEWIENGRTGEPISIGSAIEQTDLPPGQYTLEISGQPNTAFNVLIVTDPGDGTAAVEERWIGTTDGNGKGIHQITFSNLVIYNDFGPVDMLCENARVFVKYALVTAVVPSGFYLQPFKYKLPALFVPSERTDLVPLTLLTNIQARVVNGRLVLESFTTNTGEIEKKPVGVATGKLNQSMHLFAKTFGRVTEVLDDGIVLNNEARVKFHDPVLGLEVGQTISVKGVWHDNIFYTRGANQIQSF